MSSLRRQGAWALVDQVLSSGTNFFPALLLARVLGPQSYGTFSLAFLAWFCVLNIVRSGLMQPYTLAAAPLEGAEWRDVTKRASGAVVLAGVICGAIFAVVAACVGISSELGRSLLVIAVLAPGLVLQEFWRIASFAARRARTAAANDLYWAIGQIAAFGFLLSRGDATPAGSLLAWGLGALVAAGLGVVQLSVMPRVDLAALRWAREWGRVGGWFTATTAVFSLGFYGVAIVIAAKIGSAGLGLFRAVQNLFGPIQLLLIAAESVYLPHLVRLIKKRQASGLEGSWRYSLAMAGSVTAYGLVLLVVGQAVLTKIYGPAFGAAAVLVLPTLIAFVLDAIGDGASLFLRARAMGSRLLVAQVIVTTTRVTAVAVLAGVGGLRGAAWGLVVGSSIAVIVMWTQLVLVSVRKPRRRDGGPPKLAHDLQLADAD